jgi:hypothetical protein
MVEGRSTEGLIGALWSNRPSVVKRCQTLFREVEGRMRDASFVVIMEADVLAPATRRVKEDDHR